MSYPQIRLRRLRNSNFIRSLVAEHKLDVNDLIWPCFVVDGERQIQPITTMPGVERYSIDTLLKKLEHVVALGIKAIALFPSIDSKLKDKVGSQALNENNLICRCIKAIKQQWPNLGVIADVALDPYTSHGHDGIYEHGHVANDKTVEVLKQQAIILAASGADVVAPSDMMDGRIGQIRLALDKDNFTNTLILSYSAKFASNFYGPFRDGVGSRSATVKPDKSSYQLSYKITTEAIRETGFDIKEGADMVMVKPAMAYLDIITKLTLSIDVPLFAYQVSGEYAMLKYASSHGCFDYNSALYESLVAIKRAGARAIITYGAIEMAELLNKY